MSAPDRLPVVDPPVDPDNAAFWEATTRGVLLLQRCSVCTEVVWYPRSFCPHCGSRSLETFEASGLGTVHTFTIVRKSRREGWAGAVPYVVARVELAEGPCLLSNIVGCAPDDVRIDMPVEVVFENVHEGAAVYRFRPAGR